MLSYTAFVQKTALTPTDDILIFFSEEIKCLDYKTNGSLYVHGCCRYMLSFEKYALKGKTFTATRKLFKFSKSKTQCVHFCQQRTTQSGPTLHMWISDTSCCWIKISWGYIWSKTLLHTPYEIPASQMFKNIKSFKSFNSYKLGCGPVYPSYRYCSLIRSKLDYGSIVYGSARTSYLQKLDSMHHQGPSLAMGAFRTSPVSSLYVAADEPSLLLCRKTSLFSFDIRLAANT